MYVFGVRLEFHVLKSRHHLSKQIQDRLSNICGSPIYKEAYKESSDIMCVISINIM